VSGLLDIKGTAYSFDDFKQYRVSTGVERLLRPGASSLRHPYQRPTVRWLNGTP